ncbi:MAG: glutamine--fructose-6-phosphate transaminase (isomerizing) [Bacteroidetes bacterium]|nr:glutamine--fructose-6-phosphate transaminase (isomerizing) [Bacteroidota bacterium]MBK8364452.1 glutamine--fructose-6-phosphate transaminase (isomerizing) [Bacteroidota bacterium]MBK9413875.1 glutamine--fructose-6-phosphate transaminase (isomerizing) [Bacteroidota bacterium]MBL0033958.1 glutamine--fructose-6-phosphate transaminase (isomerizing) [Bacteroidota bacterium]MBP6657931.1 glutamine--fructose-6-phosphate transaminase (isomerizing) [Bacteroidia bacterium]
MCGIVAYIGHREAYPIIIKGLQRLEYRGYDSAGVAILNGDLKVYKKAGKVSDLNDFVKGKDVVGKIGMGHTRWATHGEPNDRNAHPHYSQSSKFAIIHNGIIENYSSIKAELIKRGHTFNSDTDTEVLIHLIEDIHENGNVSLEEAVRLALGEVIGAYAIVVLSKDNPNELICARKGSPIVLGVGKNKDEYFVASDATPIIEYTNNVIYLNDGEVAYIKDGKLTVKTIENQVKTPYIHELEMKLEQLEKGGYEHFMLKEIYEQPRSIWDSMRGRIDAKKGFLRLGGIAEYENKFVKAKRIVIIGCGTSWHAGLVAEYLIEDLARIPVEVEYASEFRYRNPVIYEDDIVIPISQSGETADTLAAIELAKSKGATIFGVCNVVGSSIPRATHAGAYTHAGPEIGVASTKAFTAQVTVLTLMALQMARSRGTITDSRFHQLLNELEAIPAKVERALLANDAIKLLAERFKDAPNALYLGRGYGFPVALEGALKLKEISYIHAEGYPAAEMKHGPIALIDEEMPVVVIATKNETYEKVVSNIQEVKARKGIVIAIITEGDETVKGMADYCIEVPETDDILVPLISVVPLQLLSYHIAVLRGCNVDQPRNLAKSVTVE